MAVAVLDEYRRCVVGPVGGVVAHGFTISPLPFTIYDCRCEGMSTYPRTYDLIHADSVFTLYKNRYLPTDNQACIS
jgi:hypothetical protein